MKSVALLLLTLVALGFAIAAFVLVLTDNDEPTLRASKIVPETIGSSASQNYFTLSNNSPNYYDVTLPANPSIGSIFRCQVNGYFTDLGLKNFGIKFGLLDIEALGFNVVRCGTATSTNFGIVCDITVISNSIVNSVCSVSEGLSVDTTTYPGIGTEIDLTVPHTFAVYASLDNLATVSKITSISLEWLR